MDERRKGDERIPLRARVWCEDEEVTLYVPAVDVSDGGVCVRTAHPFEEGQEVRLGLSGPEGDAVVTARVAWSRPTRDTPATGLSLGDFESGREVFEKMVSKARRNARRLRSPLPIPQPSIRQQSMEKRPGPDGDSTP